MRTFPIMLEDRLSSIPYDLIAPHEAQAKLNHAGQTIERLAQRGGVTVEEALAIIEDRKWERMPATASYLQLKAYVDDFLGVMPSEGDLQTAALMDSMAEWDKARAPAVLPAVPAGPSPLERLDKGIALATRMRGAGLAPRHQCNELINIMQGVRDSLYG